MAEFVVESSHFYNRVSHTDGYAELGGAESGCHLQCRICLQVRWCMYLHIRRIPLYWLLMPSLISLICLFVRLFIYLFAALWRAWQTAACISKILTAFCVKPWAWRNRSATLRDAGRNEQSCCYCSLTRQSVTCAQKLRSPLITVKEWLSIKCDSVSPNVFIFYKLH